MRYRFFPAADRRQDEIWDYTAEQWGEPKAVEYIRGLHNAISEAAGNPKLWRRLDRKGFEKFFTSVTKSTSYSSAFLPEECWV